MSVYEKTPAGGRKVMTLADLKDFVAILGVIGVSDDTEIKADVTIGGKVKKVGA